MGFAASGVVVVEFAAVVEFTVAVAVAVAPYAAVAVTETGAGCNIVCFVLSSNVVTT